MNDPTPQDETLEALAGALNYRAWLCSLVAPYLGDHPLEIGSGLGDYAQTWLDSGLPAISLTDIDPRRESLLRLRFQGDSRVVVERPDILESDGGTYSAVVSLNVLEHVDDDIGFLRSAHRLVGGAGAGYVVTLAPAFPAAMSDFDRSIGHLRRYTRASLSNAYSQAGMSVRQCAYVNSLGLIAWFVGMRVLRLTPSSGSFLGWWDATAIPRIRRLEQHYEPPFGQSVLCVGT